MPGVLAIVVNYNGGHWVESAVESLLGQVPPVDVLVVDNGSTDGSFEAIATRFPAERVRTARNAQNTGATGGFNYALSYPQYDFYFQLNPDAFATPETVAALAGILERNPEYAIAGATIVDYDDENRVQEFAPRLDPTFFPCDAFAGKNVAGLPQAELVESFYACGAAVLVRAEPLRDVGGWDPDFFMFVDEADLSWRLRLRGWKTGVAPGVRVRHVGGGIAPAGFEEGTYQTSLRRVFLRERNALWMGIKCFAWPTLAFFLLVDLSHLLMEMVVLALIGRKEIARTYASALAAVWASRAAVLEKRRRIQATRTRGEWESLRLLAWRWGKLDALRARGVPKIVDFTAASKQGENKAE